MSQAATAMAALANPTRRGIFETLHHSPLSVNDLASTQTVSRPAVSQHLQVLADAGLVTFDLSGNTRTYRTQQSGLIAIHDYLDKFWADALTNYKREVVRRTKGDAL